MDEASSTLRPTFNINLILRVLVYTVTILCCVCFNLYCGGFILCCKMRVFVCVDGFCNVWARVCSFVMCRCFGNT